MSAVTAASVLLLPRGGPCRCHSGPQIPGREDRTEHNTEMHSGSGSKLNVLLPTRPGTWAEADPLLSCLSQHGERRRARGLQCLQTKHRRLPSHAEVCQPLPDICVLLCQQLLHSAAWPPPFCAKKQMRALQPGTWGAPCRLLAPAHLEPTDTSWQHSDV